MPKDYKTLNINIPIDVHTQLKKQAVDREIFLRDHIKKILRDAAYSK